MAPSIDQLLTIACSKGASDLHIKAGSFPFMRINGELQPMVERVVGMIGNEHFATGSGRRVLGERG